MIQRERDLRPVDIKVAVFGDPVRIIAYAEVEGAVLVRGGSEFFYAKNERKLAYERMAQMDADYPKLMHALGPISDRVLSGPVRVGSDTHREVRIKSFRRGQIAIWTGPKREDAVGVYKELLEAINRGVQ